jgi:hypothetical protein
MGLWYISFATDKACLGCTFVDGSDAEDALANATRLGINPGGEAVMLELPSNYGKTEPSKSELAAFKNRLVLEEEILARGGKKHKDVEPELRAILEDKALRICGDCNPPGTRH